MTENRLSQLDIAALFHGVLFAYQKTLKEVLGETPQLPHRGAGDLGIPEG